MLNARVDVERVEEGRGTFWPNSMKKLITFFFLESY